MPELGCGSEVSVISLQVRPPSFDQISKMRALLRAAERLQPIVAVLEDARLDRADLFAVVDRRRRLPGLAAVAGALEVHAPAVVLGA